MTKQFYAWQEKSNGEIDIATELLLKAVQRVLSVATERYRSRAPLDSALKMALDNLSIVHNDYQRCIEA